MDVSSQIVDPLGTADDLLVPGRLTVEHKAAGFRANLVGIVAYTLGR